MDVKTIGEIAKRRGKSKIQGMNASKAILDDDFIKRTYAITNKELSKSSYSYGPVEDLNIVEKIISLFRYQIVDITNHKDPIIKYCWSFANCNWDKVELNFEVWRSN